jgi:hypothetical protein
MDKKAWPYLAGLIDSDGCITICMSCNPSGNKSYSLVIKITNTNRHLMKWLVRNFGGSYTQNCAHNGFKLKSIVFDWRCPAPNQEALLLGILPHLIIKKDKALIGLEFRRTEILREREYLHQKIAQLKEVDVRIPERFIRNKDASKYIAGYIDGDGWISIENASTPRIGIGSVNFIIIKWLLAHFGGRFHSHLSGRKKVLYIWRISGASNTEKFLLDILPHLTVKKQKAKLAIQMIRLRRLDPKGDSELISKQMTSLISEFHAATTNMQNSHKSDEERV